MKRVIAANVKGWRGRMARKPGAIKRLLTDVPYREGGDVNVEYTDFGKTHTVLASTLKGQTVIVGPAVKGQENEKVTVA